MHRSSTFSSDTFQVRLWLPLSPLIFLIFLACTELLLRVPAVAAALPVPETVLWHADNVQRKLAYLERLESNSDVDTLFIGNSTVFSGIDPEAFDRARAENGLTSGVAFNGGLEGIPAYGALVFTQVYLQYSHPNTLIYGITPQDINENSPSVQDITDRIRKAPLVIATTRQDVAARLLKQLLDHFRVFRYRSLLHRMLLTAARPAFTDYYIGERGYASSEHRLSDVPRDQRQQYFYSDGVMNYTIEGEQVEALRQLMQFAKDRNLRLILVNMPLADDYYTNFEHPNDYEAYLTAVRSLAAEYQTPFWDMEALPADQAFSDAEFADFNHLNRYGAQRLGELLAEYLSSPKG